LSPLPPQFPLEPFDKIAKLWILIDQPLNLSHGVVDRRMIPAPKSPGDIWQRSHRYSFRQIHCDLPRPRRLGVTPRGKKVDPRNSKMNGDNLLDVSDPYGLIDDRLVFGDSKPKLLFRPWWLRHFDRRRFGLGPRRLGRRYLLLVTRNRSI
jgi:hypothetical protein